jgi:hypothetical protein
LFDEYLVSAEGRNNCERQTAGVNCRPLQQANNSTTRREAFWGFTGYMRHAWPQWRVCGKIFLTLRTANNIEQFRL